MIFKFVVFSLGSPFCARLGTKIEMPPVEKFEAYLMQRVIKMVVTGTARMVYFWGFIILLHLVVGLFLGKLIFRLPIDEWAYWFAGCVAVAVGRFPLLDDFLDEHL